MGATDHLPRVQVLAHRAPSGLGPTCLSRLLAGEASPAWLAVLGRQALSIPLQPRQLGDSENL